MKMNSFLCAVAVACSFACLEGCGMFSSPRPAMSFACVSTIAPNAEQLKVAIVTSAARRRWEPTEVESGTFRCVIQQCCNHVEIEIRILEDGKSYSMTPVNYNISSYKVDQWTGNLKREINYQLARMIGS